LREQKEYLFHFRYVLILTTEITTFGVARHEKSATQTFIYLSCIKGDEAIAMTDNRNVSGNVGNFVAPEPRVSGGDSIAPTGDISINGVF